MEEKFSRPKDVKKLIRKKNENGTFVSNEIRIIEIVLCLQVMFQLISSFHILSRIKLIRSTFYLITVQSLVLTIQAKTERNSRPREWKAEKNLMIIMDQK